MRNIPVVNQKGKGKNLKVTWFKRKIHFKLKNDLLIINSI